MAQPVRSWRGACVPLVMLVATSATALALLPSDVRAEPRADAAALTKADWRSDLAFARAELPKRHANLWHTLSPAAWHAAFDRLERDVDRLQEHEIVVRLAEIVAAVGDGYVVTQAAAGLEDLLGSRLAGIDGRDVPAVESALSPVVNRDNDHQLHELMPTFMVVPEVLHARGISPSPSASRWKFTDAAGRDRDVTMQPVVHGITAAWKRLPAPGWPRAGSGPRDGNLWFADIAEPAAVYARIVEIADAPSRTFASFANELGAHLATTRHRRLVIDLRGNPGGDNSLNAPLVRALIRTPWVTEPGALFVLIDDGTFSAAMNLALDLEHWLPAVFVGSGTGARPNSYGDARKLVLPRSGLTVRLSSLYWQNHPNDHRTALLPLIEAPRTAVQLRSAIDPAEATLAQLDAPADALSGRWSGRLAVGFRHEEVALTLPADGSAAGGTFAAPGLGLAEAPIIDLERGSDTLRCALTARSGTRVPVAARAGGNRLVGWLEYRGNRYPFVLKRQ